MCITLSNGAPKNFTCVIKCTHFFVIECVSHLTKKSKQKIKSYFSIDAKRVNLFHIKNLSEKFVYPS